MLLYNDLERLFGSINLEFCDLPATSIIKSNEYSTLRKLVPKWAKLIQKGLEIDKQETLRTIRHIFRSICIYFLIQNDQFFEDLNADFKSFLKLKFNHLYDIHPDLFINLLLYHDIGRPFNKEWHTFESAKMIQEDISLITSEIPQKYIKILLGVIKYHLLLGTIFTGESSYGGAITLLKDQSLNNIWEIKEESDLFFQILLIFTVIDILGYDYSKIYNHYLPYYLKIKRNLESGFNHIRIIKKIEKKETALFSFFQKLDKENLKWRIACSLRIFQFVSTKANLTEDFYFRKIDQGLESVGSNWQVFTEKLGESHSLIQYKYALPIMMILASGSFSRTPIDKNFIVESNIYRFWEVCTSKVKKDSKSLILNLWNFVFQFPRNWFRDPIFLTKLTSENLFSLIKRAKQVFDPSISAYQVYINYQI